MLTELFVSCSIWSVKVPFLPSAILSLSATPSTLSVSHSLPPSFESIFSRFHFSLWPLPRSSSIASSEGSLGPPTTKRSKGPSLLLARSLNRRSFCCRDWIKSDSDSAPSVLSVWSVFLCYLIYDTLLLWFLCFTISESHLSLIHIFAFLSIWYRKSDLGFWVPNWWWCIG